MKELFLPYELALELKELGFNECCFAQYGETEKGIGFEIWNDENYEEWRNSIKAPTFSQAFRFFREKYDIKPCFDWHPTESYRYCLYYKKGTDSMYYQRCDFETYEQSELECIKALIKLAKEQNNEKDI